jgi:ABC-type phosphate transport system substrate-binding protein
MRFLTTRRKAACIASMAAMAVAAVPATSVAAGPKTDRNQQCAGENIEGRGSTFQNPAQLIWNPGFNTTLSTTGCSGTQGSLAKPTVTYRNTESKDRGSGACLKAFGAEKHATETTQISFCGTDEAPNEKQKEEIEEHKVGGGAQALETVPVLQGAVAIIVHLPAGCRAQSEAIVNGKAVKPGRLVLDDATVAGIYEGTIKTWKKLVEEQKGHGADKLICEEPAEEEETITPVVRTDHSGTTHIFKAFLEQVNTSPIKMEEYPEEYYGNKTGCGTTYPSEAKTWAEVAEACPNQRWPEAAHVVRNTENGNPGVVKLVNRTPSSVGYADLAVAREYGYFSNKANTLNHKGTPVTNGGGENIAGEKNDEFWAPLQNSKEAGETYQDPASASDTEKVAS